MPVVINEIAWSGTSATYYNDEWIEFYNRTSHNINISGWRLASSDSDGPNILFWESSANTVNAVIPAKGFYLIERTDDNTVKDIAADWKGSFGDGLDNGGEILTLSYASTTIDKTAFCSPSNWCPSYDYKYRTMERIDYDVSGSDPTNWSPNNATIKNGKNAGDSAISGTPKARNSVNYLIAKGVLNISSDITLLKSKSPYLVDNIIQNFVGNSTLTIEPGVVIKFNNDGGFLVSENAAIIARGTASEPIVFTGFQDDVYGGDTNNDAALTSPYAGSWQGIKIQAAIPNSIFENTLFRYGGKYYSGGGTNLGMANLNLENASASVASSTFEYSINYGLKLSNSSSTVSNSVFRYNNQSPDPSGYSGAIYVRMGAPLIQLNTFLGNRRGLYALGSYLFSASSNSFASNTQEAIYLSSAAGDLENNSGYSNGLNGILVSGNFTMLNSTTTLKANAMPYVLSSYPVVVSSSTLAIDKGAVIKGLDNSRLDVYGSLFSEEESADDIVFTSIHDDTIAGDTGNNGSSVLPQAGYWRGISVYSGARLNMKGFTMSYAGGSRSGGDTKGGIYIMNNATANINTALFDKNYQHGIRLEGLSLTLKNSTIKDTTEGGVQSTTAGLRLYSGNASLDNVIFSGNLLAIYKDAASTLSATNITFTNNTATTSPPNLF